MDAVSESLRYGRVLAYVRESAWAIRPDTLAVMVDMLRFRAEGGRLTRDEIAARLPAEARNKGIGVSIIAPDAADAPIVQAGQGGAPKGSVAVIPVHGVIANRAAVFSETSSSGCGLDVLMQRFRGAMADAGVGSIVLDIDSPGGNVSGVAEAASEILAARDQKRVVAVANHLAASAAYHIACSATELVVSPSAMVGSIGVFAAHEDLSKAMEDLGVKVTLVSAGKYKTEGNPFEPLSEEARAALQATVDAYYTLFVDGVAKGRGVKAKAVRDGFGQGRVVTADDAVSLGMADRVATLDQTIARLVGRSGSTGARADAMQIDVTATSEATKIAAGIRRRRLAIS